MTWSPPAVSLVEIDVGARNAADVEVTWMDVLLIAPVSGVGATVRVTATACSLSADVPVNVC
jgi:hypothetical protein